MRTTRRLLGIGLAALGLVLLAPVLAAAALTVRVTMGRPDIFRDAVVARLEALDLGFLTAICRS